jgi:hypothetical protein
MTGLKMLSRSCVASGCGCYGAIALLIEIRSICPEELVHMAHCTATGKDFTMQLQKHGSREICSVTVHRLTCGVVAQMRKVFTEGFRSMLVGALVTSIQMALEMESINAGIYFAELQLSLLLMCMNVVAPLEISKHLRHIAENADRLRVEFMCNYKAMRNAIDVSPCFVTWRHLPSCAYSVVRDVFQKASGICEVLVGWLITWLSETVPGLYMCMIQNESPNICFFGIDKETRIKLVGKLSDMDVYGYPCFPVDDSQNLDRYDGLVLVVCYTHGASVISEKLAQFCGLRFLLTAVDAKNAAEEASRNMALLVGNDPSTARVFMGTGSDLAFYGIPSLRNVHTPYYAWRGAAHNVPPLAISLQPSNQRALFEVAMKLLPFGGAIAAIAVEVNRGNGYWQRDGWLMLTRLVNGSIACAFHDAAFACVADEYDSAGVDIEFAVIYVNSDSKATPMKSFRHITWKGKRCAIAEKSLPRWYTAKIASDNVRVRLFAPLGSITVKDS